MRRQHQRDNECRRYLDGDGVAGREGFYVRDREQEDERAAGDRGEEQADGRDVEHEPGLRERARFKYVRGRVQQVPLRRGAKDGTTCIKY